VSANDRPYKLAMLFSHPIQNHVPVFRELSARDDVDLTVYYGCDYGVTEQRDPEFGIVFKWDVPMLDGYEHEFLPNWSTRPGPTFFGEINPSIMSELVKQDFDAIFIVGYSVLTCWFAFVAAWFTRTPIVLRGVSHILDERPLHVRIIKRLVLGPLFATAARCLYIGNHNKAYYQEYGVSERKLMHAPHVVGDAFFRDHREKLMPRRDAIRREFGIDDDAPVVLFPGKLIDCKDPLLLLEAFRRVRERHPCHLLYAGDGALRGEMERRIRDQSIPDVVLAGFLNQSEMPKAYLAADLMALPSKATETWGLVVNEGMNFGLPVIVSDRVGCGTDLVRPGENGYITDSLESLTAAVESLVSDSEQRARYGRRSDEIIAGWGVPDCADGIIAAVRSVARRS